MLKLLKSIIIWIVGLSFCGNFLNADNINDKNTSKYGSYNYIAFGFESINYQEIGTLSDGSSFISNATADSPVYLSGSLTRINEKYDFSIDAISTLLPTQADETWHADGVLASTDKLELLVSSIKFLGQYKKTNNHRISSGLRYDLNLYKRHTYRDVSGNTMVDSDGNKISLTEEKVATLSLMGGYIYENAPHSNGRYRYKFSALAGIPIWRNATNTGFKDITYNSTTGYSYEIGGYFGYEIIKGLEIGMFADYDYQIKTGGDKIDGVLWPENTLKVFRSGLSFVWNFN
ncbi:MAG: hypothetical protein DRG78_06795 [Epsilonproteobacteria bacterium]|nr:MAG: hypothetical protein DRG78_06795 [Campylobacterota bacterium]